MPRYSVGHTCEPWTERALSGVLRIDSAEAEIGDEQGRRVHKRCVRAVRYLLCRRERMQILGRVYPVNEHIRQLRAELAALDARRREAESELAAALAEAGRRPGDGSDQLPLFEVAEPTLWDRSE